MITRERTCGVRAVTIPPAVPVTAAFRPGTVANAVPCPAVFPSLMAVRSIRRGFLMQDNDSACTPEPQKAQETLDGRGHESDTGPHLRPLMEADGELSDGPSIDRMSPTYNIQLNRRVRERLMSASDRNGLCRNGPEKK